MARKVVGFGEDDLRALAGPRSFERGLGYLDAVSALEVGDGSVTASVRGTDVYVVELTLGEDDVVSGECDCPYGQEGNFCKHCVAVGLTVLRRAKTIPPQRAAARARASGLDAWLTALSRDELLTLVREQIADDRGLRRRLELRAAAARSDLGTVRDRILALIDPRPFARYGYIEYADAPGYAQQVAEAAGALRALTGGGRAAEAVGLAEEAIRVLGEAYEAIDDSDGVVGRAAAAVADVHLEACGAARTDPERLAEWLVGQVLGDSNDVPDLDPLDYAEVLGASGLACVRQLAAEARRRRPSGWAERYLMERLVRAEGDVDALVALYAQDLDPSGATHLRIAEELESAGRADEALRWAERGLRDCAAETYVDGRLVDYVCARYAKAGRPDDVVGVRRDRFGAERSLAAYRHLRAAAQAAECWEAERVAALAALREDARRERGRRYGGPVLIDVLLDDGDVDAAWREAGGLADDRQWERLADLSRESRPAEALAVYLRLAERLKEPTGERAYEHLARVLVGARECHRVLGTQEAFADHLVGLRVELKRRRKLMSVLDRHRL
ncbi:SWIM zinc finger family protein [Streptomyces sp. B1866]|uniref:SWIM zinc finger family protein n=1 Tax=Streptomyces sp. B1866 TaxID=3075431 RepID=UPI0028914182|nr:SWIM zinc finger family protein [Streptomyces sp. B1866]MDT3395412.1 SWIM zinc finger family protein [Streptomyces sp. B1866]